VRPPPDFSAGAQWSNEFYINVCGKSEFTEGEGSTLTYKLPQTLYFKEDWECALTELSFTQAWGMKEITPPLTFKIRLLPETEDEDCDETHELRQYEIGSEHYRSTQDIVTAMNNSLQWQRSHEHFETEDEHGGLQVLNVSYYNTADNCIFIYDQSTRGVICKVNSRGSEEGVASSPGFHLYLSDELTRILGFPRAKHFGNGDEHNVIGEDGKHYYVITPSKCLKSVRNPLFEIRPLHNMINISMEGLQKSFINENVMPVLESLPVVNARSITPFISHIDIPTRHYVRVSVTQLSHLNFTFTDEEGKHINFAESLKQNSDTRGYTYLKLHFRVKQ
jgi:hypothetical protein